MAEGKNLKWVEEKRIKLEQDLWERGEPWDLKQGNAIPTCCRTSTFGKDLLCQHYPHSWSAVLHGYAYLHQQVARNKESVSAGKNRWCEGLSVSILHIPGFLVIIISAQLQYWGPVGWFLSPCLWLGCALEVLLEHTLPFSFNQK